MTHWYDRDGRLHDKVPNASKPGEWRDATLADAKKLGLGPSVTTVQQILAKPGLEPWQMGQTIDAVLATPRLPDEPEDEWRARVRIKANEVRDKAADFGTQVHRAIDLLARGEGRGVAIEVGVAAYQIAAEALRVLYERGLTSEAGERSFYNEQYDYGGTIDIVGTWQGRACFADVKTQEFNRPRSDVKVQKWESEEKPVYANYYPEHPIQLAGYALGVEQPKRDRVSIIVSRTHPGVVDVRNWSTYKSSNGNGWPNERADAAWLSLLETWKLVNAW